MVVPVNLEFGPGPQIRRDFLEFFPRRQIRGLQKGRFCIALAMPDKSARIRDERHHGYKESYSPLISLKSPTLQRTTRLPLSAAFCSGCVSSTVQKNHGCEPLEVQVVVGGDYAVPLNNPLNAVYRDRG